MSAQELPAGNPAEEPLDELTPEQEAARLKRRKRLLTLLALFLLLDVFIAGVLVARIRADRLEHAAVRDAQAQKIGVTQEMTEEEREEMLAIALGEAHSLIALNSEPAVSDGRIALNLVNHKSNHCAVAVQLIRIDTNETLLETDLVEPGWYLEYAKLDVQLEPGEYECLARCLFYTMDDNAYLGRTARQLLLKVP
ncbi:MAG: hypothetical protein IKJ11_05195 [Clostridia bacterium]|nr:hypothetical protein [Clostridia bacterium]